MILYDTPRATTFRRFRRTAHCMSDMSDPVAARAELLDFARRVRLSPEWLQRRGEAVEHFDLFDGAIERARRAGAEEVTDRELILRCVLPKKAAARTARRVAP